MKLFFVSLLIFVFPSCSFFISKLIPLNDLPVPTGLYNIGTQIFYWTDNNRDEWFTENDLHDKRRLVVQMWYPTDSNQQDFMFYIPKPEFYLDPIAYQLGMPKFIFNHISSVRTNSIYHARIHPEINNAPLIIFSHGLGGMRTQNTTQIEELVSNGYIVISIDHSYDANLTLFEDNTIANFRSGVSYLQMRIGEGNEITEQDFWEYRLPQIKTRRLDVSFVIDKLEELKDDNDFFSRIDLDKIGFLGHSYGGTTGIYTSIFDRRIMACAILDGWMVPITSEILSKGLRIPMLYIGRDKWDSPLNNSNLDILIKNSSNTTKIVLLDTKHFDYTDIPHFSSFSSLVGVSGSYEKNKLLDLINSSILSFFDYHL